MKLDTKYGIGYKIWNWIQSMKLGTNMTLDTNMKLDTKYEIVYKFEIVYKI